MEDYGYTFEDLSAMSHGQKIFLISSKIERIRLEKESIEKAQQEAKAQGRSAKKKTLGPTRLRRR